MYHPPKKSKIKIEGVGRLTIPPFCKIILRNSLLLYQTTLGTVTYTFRSGQINYSSEPQKSLVNLQIPYKLNLH